jgi:hypothetical protein
MPSWSIGIGSTPTAGDAVDDEQRVRVARELRDLLDRMQRARRRLARLHVDGARLRELLERGRDHLRDDGAPPLDADLVDLDAVGLTDLRPALAELAAVDDDHLVAGRAQVRDRALHRAGARRGEE